MSEGWRSPVAALALVLTLTPSVAAARPVEGADALDAPRTGPREVAPAPAEEPPAPGGRRAERPARASRFTMGWTWYRLADGHGGGRIHAFDAGANLTPTSPLRLGLRGELGSRRYALAGDDLVLRGALLVGYQHRPTAARVVPYAQVALTVGSTVGKRFHTPQRDPFGGAGVEVGVELSPVAGFSVIASLSYLRLSMRGLAHDAVLVGLSLGL